MNDSPESLRPTEHRSTMQTIAYLLFGPIVWAAHLTLIYGAQSVACAVLAPSLRPAFGALDAVQLTIVVATIAALLIVAVGWYALTNPGGAMSEGKDEGTPFIEDTMRLLVVLSAFGISAAGSAALVLPTCDALR